MKVYFACSVRGGRDDKHIYEELVEYLKDICTVLTEFNVDKDLTPLGTPGATSLTYKRDMQMLSQAQAVIAEVTTPSLGVGYEIAKAEAMKLPILALYRPHNSRSLSAMIDGSPSVKVIEYKDVQKAKDAIKAFVSALKI